MNYPKQIKDDLSDSEEPKYKIRLRTANHGTEKEVSTAQVQFWPDLVENFQQTILDKADIGTSAPPEVIRVDLMTNSYYPDWIKQLK